MQAVSESGRIRVKNNRLFKTNAVISLILLIGFALTAALSYHANYRQTFRYVVCGGANVAFSWVCYFLVYNFVLDKEQLDLGFVVVSAYVATMLLIFPFTFFTGFWLNRYVTFRHSPLPTGTQLFRYLLSIGGSVVVNYVGLKFFVEFCGLWATPSQMLATFVTMIYSYLAAKYFTFRHAEV